MLEAITDPWAEPITRRALLACILLAVGAGLLGCWLVLYELSYSTESLAHALLPGLVGAALIGAPLMLGAAVGIAVAAGASALVARTPLLDRDVTTAIVVTPLLALGILLALSPRTPAGIGELLFGDVLGVGDGEIAAAAALVVVLAIVLPLVHGRLAAIGFDREGAAALGLPAAAADAALLGLLALALLVSVQALGNLLVVALLIAPAATARVVTRRLRPMMALSVAVAVTGSAGGLYLSYHASTAAGASIAAVLAGIFLAVSATYHVR